MSDETTRSTQPENPAMPGASLRPAAPLQPAAPAATAAPLQPEAPAETAAPKPSGARTQKQPKAARLSVSAAATRAREEVGEAPVICCPSRLQQYQALLGKDFTMEFRTKEMLTSMGVYGVLVLLVFGAALAMTSAGFDVTQMASGLIWVLVVFTSLLGLNRSFSHEKEDGAIEGLLLVPMDRSLVFLAKTTTNLVLLLVVEAIVIPLFFFFFLSGAALPSTVAWIIAPLVVGSIGVAGVGTLLSTITINTRSRDVLLAIMFIPVIFPLLYACVGATSQAFLGMADGMYGFLSALALAAGYDAIMIVASWALYDFVISA